MPDAENKSGKNSRTRTAGSEEDSSPKTEKAPPGFEYKRLYRSRTNRMIAGVCGGVAEYFSLDPTLVRILFIICAFIGGFGVLAYITAWIIVPEKKDETVHADTVSRTPLVGIVVGFILVLAGLSMIMDRMTFWMPRWLHPLFSWEALGAFFFIGLGILLVSRVMGRHAVVPVVKPSRSSLFRSRTNRKLSGICGGIGEYFGIDPTIIRILWIVGTLLTHLLGILIYILLIFVMPEEPAVEEETS